MTRHAHDRGQAAMAAEAKSLLERVLASRGAISSKRDVGRLELLGEGPGYVVYCAGCDVAERAGRVHRRVVVRMPRKDEVRAPGDVTRIDALQEATLLQHLATLTLPFRVPRVVATAPTTHGMALVETFVDGLPLDLRAGKTVKEPWELVATAAAGCHAIDPDGLRHLVPKCGTRRDHASAELRYTEALHVPEAAVVAAWGHAHLPPRTPARFLHGDLLGPNLVCPLPAIRGVREAEPRMGVLDWQHARLGDPAYDLAVVTRGAAHPFGATDGFQRLIDAYESRTGTEMPVRDVHLHEACLLAASAAAAAREHPLDSPHARTKRDLVLRFLDRVEGG